MKKRSGQPDRSSFTIYERICVDMQTIEIARKFTALGQKNEAVKAYKLALSECKDQDPAAELECALYILQLGRGGDYKIAYSCFVELFNRGFAQTDILAVMDEAFYQPNVKKLQKRYEKNCKLLAKYPYIFRQDFPAFAELPLRFFPYDDNEYMPYLSAERRFAAFYQPRRQVVSRNFFKDLEKPILAADVFSQYELEYLNDNVRKSEYIGRENHVYLHYTNWPVFCAYLQVLDLQSLLKEQKIVVLIENEIEQYPLDFKRRFGIDYSQYPLKPLGVREIHRLIWHTQLSSDNGGDYFNEVFDSHPNLLTMPSIMFDNILQKVKDCETVLSEAESLAEAQQGFSWESKELTASLFYLRNRTPKDLLAALYLANQEFTSPHLDKASRIAPAIFFQPHFHNIYYDLQVNERGQYLLYSEQYDTVRQAPFFRDFKYIKTFTPMRCISSAHAATVKYKCYRLMLDEQKAEAERDTVMDDALLNRVLNRSFMIDWQDRLFTDCRLVRFEDAKLNRVATFTALAAFLDIPYADSMNYCSTYGKRDPLSDVGNDQGFSPATIYRKNADYANDAERAFIEFCMRDAYRFYGYDFEYYDGQPVDEERLAKWLEEFTVIDGFIYQSHRPVLAKTADQSLKKAMGDKVSSVKSEDYEAAMEEVSQKLLEHDMQQIKAKRQLIADILRRDNLQFINRNGQPLHMMPLLEPDPALLVMPLYRSTKYPKVDVEVKEFSHKEMKPLEETN